MLSPGSGGVAVRRVRRRLARHRQRAPQQARHSSDFERLVERNAMAFDTTEMCKHVQHRIAGGEIGVGRVGAPQRPGPRRLAQHVQAGGVIHLCIDEHDGADGAVAQRAPRLQHPVRVDLRQDVGGCIDECPGVAAIRGNRDGRLRARLAAQRAVAQATTVRAVAVPLGKAATGGGSEYADFHRSPRWGACGGSPSAFSGSTRTS